MNEMEMKLGVLQDFLSCSHTALWHFDHSMELLSGPSSDQEELLRLMKIGGSQELIRKFCKDSAFPGFCSDLASLMWLAEAERAEDAVIGYYVIGPVFNSFYSEAKLRASVETMHLSPPVSRRVMNLLRSIPSIHPALIMQYGLLLHRILTGELAETSDIQVMSPVSDRRKIVSAADSAEARHEKEAAGSSFMSNGRAGGHGYALETQIFGAVEQGNIAYEHPREVLQMKVGMLSSDPLQNAKYEIVTAVTLATRAAIRGGLDENIAYNLSDYYIRMIDSLDNVGDIYQVARDMFRDFTERVHRSKLAAGRSKEIQECVNYLELHIDRTVSLQELADSLGYNRNYLCSKFHRETGMSIKDYVMDLKLERAGVLLKNTELSVGEICDALGYTSTSYFCALFKKRRGMTPLAYRNS